MGSELNESQIFFLASQVFLLVTVKNNENTLITHKEHMKEKRRIKNAGHNGLTLPVPRIQFLHRQRYLALVSLTN